MIDARIRRASTGRPVDRLLEHLQKVDPRNRYTILLAKGDGWQPKSRRFTVAVCKYKQFSFNPLQQIAYALQLYRLKPDLVHFTLSGQQPLFYFGRQITFTHDLTMLKYTRRGRLPKWLHRLRMRGYRLLLRQGHRRAKQIIVPSEWVKDAVQKYHIFTGRKVAVTPEAADPPLAGGSKRPDYAPDEFIMYVGTAFPHKNLRRLVSAFGIVLEKHPGLKLVLAGKQELHSRRLERWAAKKPYSEQIVFTGFVPDIELKWLYENAQAYVFPSLSEGFGLPGLEAMAHGCPVVSSNATCLPEIYGEAAYYFDPEDTEDMAKAIRKVIGNDSFRAGLIELGYKQAKKYSWQKMAEQTLVVYDEVLST